MLTGASQTSCVQLTCGRCICPGCIRRPLIRRISIVRVIVVSALYLPVSAWSHADIRSMLNPPSPLSTCVRIGRNPTSPHLCARPLWITHRDLHMPYSTVSFRMTLSDLTKYSMTRRVAWSLFWWGILSQLSAWNSAVSGTKFMHVLILFRFSGYLPDYNRNNGRCAISHTVCCWKNDFSFG